MRPLVFVLATIGGALLAAPPRATAASVTRTTASSASVVSGSWFNPTDAASHNGFCGDTLSGTIALTGYGFAVPAGAAITGVSISLWATSPAGGSTATLLTAGPASSARALIVASGTCGSAQTPPVGADGDLWGLTLAPADVNSSSFGVQIVGKGNEAIDTFDLDNAEITVFYTVPAPAAPSGLGASSAQNQVHLAWTDNSSDETSFAIERGPAASGPFASLGTSPADTPAFADTTAACNASYAYRVRAFRSSDAVYSGYSNIATVQQLCPDLTVTKSSSRLSVVAGKTFTWTLTIGNSGSGPATFSTTQAMLADALPGGPSYSNVQTHLGGSATGSFSCPISAGTLACSASSAVVIPVGSTVSVSVDASSAAAGDLINGGSGCSVNPAGALVESDGSNDACNTSTVTVLSSLIFADGFESGDTSRWSLAVP